MISLNHLVVIPIYSVTRNMSGSPPCTMPALFCWQVIWWRYLVTFVSHENSQDEDQASGSYRGPVALRQLGVVGCGVIALVRTGLCYWRVSEQEGVLVAATIVFVARPGWWGRRGQRAPGGLVVGGGRRGCHSGCRHALRPWGWEKECAVVGVLVQVGVSPPWWLGYLCGWVWISAAGHLFKLVFELLHLPG